MDGRLILAVAVLGGCYTLGPPRPAIDRVFVEVGDADGVDVDLAAEVARAMRTAAAERFELAATPSGQPVLKVSAREGASGLAPLADPSRRAAEYTVEVVLDAELLGSSGELLWRSGPISGQASYVGGSGPILRLDGDRRLAAATASDAAARRLVAALLYGARVAPKSPPG